MQNFYVMSYACKAVMIWNYLDNLQKILYEN